jgi:AraC-like DNA-binding protein
MQNQSKITTQFFDKHNFSDIPIYPTKYLWTDHPETNTCWMHAHAHLEIGRCVKGSGIFNINGNVLRINAPCSMIVYGGEFHSAQSNILDPCECNYLYIDLNAFLSRFDESVIAKIKGLDWQSYDFNHIFDNNTNTKITTLIDQMFEEAINVEEGYLEKFGCLLIALLIEHSRIMKKSENKKVDFDIIKQINPALNYINSHFNEKISLTKLSELCFISEATLRRYFYDYVKMSPNQYIQKVRMKNAKIMLSTTKAPIIDIALSIGYPTISSFNRQFQKQYNISPSAYRKLKLGE